MAVLVLDLLASGCALFSMLSSSMMKGDLQSFSKHIVSTYGPISGYVDSLGCHTSHHTSDACVSSYAIHTPRAYTPYGLTSLANVHTNDLFLYLHFSFFFGTRPVYFIADVDIVRDITVKHFDKFTDRLVSAA